MKTKRKLLVLSVLLIVLFLSACGQTANQEPNAPQASETVSTDTSESNSENTEFTIKELAEYNGKDGKPAYMAVDGVVYDVTNASPWKDGEQIHQRYYHLFSLAELRQLSALSGFIQRELFYIDKASQKVAHWSKSANSRYVGEKGVLR